MSTGLVQSLGVVVEHEESLLQKLQELVKDLKEYRHVQYELTHHHVIQNVGEIKKKHLARALGDAGWTKGCSQIFKDTLTLLTEVVCQFNRERRAIREQVATRSIEGDKPLSEMLRDTPLTVNVTIQPPAPDRFRSPMPAVGVDAPLPEILNLQHSETFSYTEEDGGLGYVEVFYIGDEDGIRSVYIPTQQIFDGAGIFGEKCEKMRRDMRETLVVERAVMPDLSRHAVIDMSNLSKFHITYPAPEGSSPGQIFWLQGLYDFLNMKLLIWKDKFHTEAPWKPRVLSSLPTPPVSPAYIHPPLVEARTEWIIETLYGVEVPLVVSVNREGGIDEIRIGTRVMSEVFGVDPLKVSELKCYRMYDAPSDTSTKVQLVNIVYLHPLVPPMEFVHLRIAQEMVRAQDNHKPFHQVFVDHKPYTVGPPISDTEEEPTHNAEKFYAYMRMSLGGTSQSATHGVNGMRLLVDVLVDSAREHSSGKRYVYSRSVALPEGTVLGAYDVIEAWLAATTTEANRKDGYPRWKDGLNKEKTKLMTWGLLDKKDDKRDVVKDLGTSNVYVMSKSAYEELRDYVMSERESEL